MAKICIDAGHGWKDPGATGFGRNEKDDVLKMAIRVGNILTQNGHVIYYTRTTDIFENVNQKAREANNFGADFFASFHRNSFTQESSNGFETCVYSNEGKAKVCADSANAIMAALGFRNRGTKIRTDLVVLNSTKMPAVLFEIGFITNSGDNMLFDSKFEQIAQALASAIAKAVGSSISSGGGSTVAPPASSSSGGSGYPGNSLVDYLKSVGQDSSFANRKKLAAQYGISNYTGTAAQNLDLLNKLRNSASSVGSTGSASSRYTGNSVVDYLKSIGKDSSFAARKQYAAQYGISDYTGTAAQNLELLNKIRGSSSGGSAPSGASYYPAFSSNSIVDGLKSIGVDSSFSHRAKIAATNGISGYSGAASQNNTLCSLGRQGKLKKA